jgi:hypothetical protein
MPKYINSGKVMATASMSRVSSVPMGWRRSSLSAARADSTCSEM